jgi:hypothetical protein
MLWGTKPARGRRMKYLICLVLLFVSCDIQDVLYPNKQFSCKQCDLEIEKNQKLIDNYSMPGITYSVRGEMPTDKFIKDQYKWKIRKCNCYN